MKTPIIATRTLAIAAACTLAATAQAAAPSGGPYEVTRSTIDAGGVIDSSGGAYKLSGTTGQHDAGPLAGGDYALTGGFWFAEPAGDCDASGTVDLVDFAALADCLLGPDAGLESSGCNCFDFDNDNDIDLLDFAAFTTHFTP